MLTFQPVPFSCGSTREAARAAARNVAVALGNWGGAPEAVPVLVRALDDDEPLIRGHAAWALGQIGCDLAIEPVRYRLDVEQDAWVQEELLLALQTAR